MCTLDVMDMSCVLHGVDLTALAVSILFLVLPITYQGLTYL